MDKGTLRKRFIEERLAYVAARRVQMDAAIVGHLEVWLKAKNPDVVALYQAIRGEPQVQEVCALLPSLKFALPVVGAAAGEMAFHEYASGDPLTKSRLGIPEPDASRPLARFTSRSVVLVPAVALDRHGTRLGYGGGFYDRFLARFPGASVGVVFHGQMVEALPRDAHDARLAFGVTEEGLVEFRA